MTSYLIFCFFLFKTKLLGAKKNKLQNSRQQPNYLQIKELSSSWDWKFWKFSMERKAGLASIAGECLGGLLTGLLGSENPSSSSMVIGFSTDSSSQGKSKSPTGWAIYLESREEQECQDSSFAQARPLSTSFAFLQVGSLSWVLALNDDRWNPCASLPPCARLGLGCLFVPEKHHRLFLALWIVLDQAKNLPRT